MLKDTTKMAYKAAIAIAIAESLSFFFQFERGYWITLTAMALTTQTWGDSLKRSLERVSMTIVGGFCGTCLYFLVPHHQSVIVTIMLVFIFVTVYLFQIYHAIAIFTLTVFVVFLFALLGNWNLDLLRDRILDTACGALIALMVGRFLLPVKTNMIEVFVGHIEKIQASLSLSFLPFQQTNEWVTSQQLYSDFLNLRNNALAIRYEFLFRRISYRDFNLLMTESGFCTQYVVGLIEAYHWLSPYLTPEDKTDVMLALRTTQHNLRSLKKKLHDKKHDSMLQSANLIDLLVKAIKSDPTRFVELNTEVLGYFNLMYFFARLNMRLNHIYLLLGNMKS